MPPPCKGHFASPGAAHRRASLSPGWGPCLGTSPNRDWGQDRCSRAGRLRGWKEDGTGCAAHRAPAYGVHRVLKGRLSRGGGVQGLLPLTETKP